MTSRARRLYDVLKDGKPATRRDIFDRVGYMLTNNAASELRAEIEPKGQSVASWSVRENGTQVYVYQLVSLGERSQHGILPDALTSSPQAAPDPGGNRVELRSPRQMSVFEAA